MIGVIIASRKVGINPDNVATPIAASLGDLITLSLLAGISTGLYKELGNTHTVHILHLTDISTVQWLQSEFSCGVGVGKRFIEQMESKI